METAGIYLWFVGIGLAAVGWVWLLIAAFTKNILWGLGVLFVPPLALVFVPVHWRRGLAPFLVVLLGGGLVGAAFAVGAYAVSRDLGPYVKDVDGEQTVTLTGWDRKDYSVLKNYPDVAVLQMANPDVTDEVLENLRGMKKLRKLDLGNTQITDRGLAVLRDMPTLEELYLQNTAITDAGIRDDLAPLDALKRIDVSGCEHVGDDAVKEWRKAKPGRKALH
jgi:hypothetical protein